MSVSPDRLRGNRLADCSPSPPPHRSQSVPRLPVNRRPGLPDRAGNHALIAWGLSREPPCAFHGNQASALGLPGGEDRIDLADGVCGHAPAGLEPPHSNSAMGHLCVSLGPARSAETLPRMPSAAHDPRPSRPTRRLVPGVELHRTHVPARTRYAVHSGKPDELVRRAALALPGFFVERPLRQWTPTAYAPATPHPIRKTAFTTTGRRPPTASAPDSCRASPPTAISPFPG